MKQKKSTLAEQVKDAQRVIKTWSKSKRELVQLQGGGLTKETTCKKK